MNQRLKVIDLIEMTYNLIISKTKINYSNRILNNQRQEEEMIE